MRPQFHDDAAHNLDGRITFQQHDYFHPQPVHDADAFLLRQCLHNLKDSDCIQILRAVVPALERCRNKTPLLINESIMPQSGGPTTRYADNYLRQMDFLMLVCYGEAKERTEREFDALLKAADPRLEIVRVYSNPLALGLLEVHLKM